MTYYEKVLHDIQNHVDNTELSSDISVALLEDSTADEEIVSLFSMYQTKRYITEDLLVQCITNYSSQKRILPLEDSIAQRALELSHTNRANMEHIAFKFVISTNGYERMMGRKLWDTLDMVKSDFDVLSYPEEVQARFALSMVQDLLFPESRLPKLMKLFNSKFSFARETLVNALYFYTLNYFGTAKEIFESEERDVTDELKTYTVFLKTLDDRFGLYRECVELHSQYALTDVYDICRKSATDNLREQIRKSQQEHRPSFLDLCRNVQLGRGVGWRNEDGSIHRLNHFTFSQERPMAIHGMTPLELNEYSMNILSDWTKRNGQQ